MQPTRPQQSKLWGGLVQEGSSNSRQRIAADPARLSRCFPFPVNSVATWRSSTPNRNRLEQSDVDTSFSLQYTTAQESSLHTPTAVALSQSPGDVGQAARSAIADGGDPSSAPKRPRGLLDTPRSSYQATNRGERTGSLALEADAPFIPEEVIRPNRAPSHRRGVDAMNSLILSHDRGGQREAIERAAAICNSPLERHVLCTQSGQLRVLDELNGGFVRNDRMPDDEGNIAVDDRCDESLQMDTPPSEELILNSSLFGSNPNLQLSRCEDEEMPEDETVAHANKENPLFAAQQACCAPNQEGIDFKGVDGKEVDGQICLNASLYSEGDSKPVYIEHTIDKSTQRTEMEICLIKDPNADEMRVDAPDRAAAVVEHSHGCSRTCRFETEEGNVHKLCQGEAVESNFEGSRDRLEYPIMEDNVSDAQSHTEKADISHPSPAAPEQEAKPANHQGSEKSESAFSVGSDEDFSELRASRAAVRDWLVPICQEDVRGNAIEVSLVGELGSGQESVRQPTPDLKRSLDTCEIKKAEADPVVIEVMDCSLSEGGVRDMDSVVGGFDCRAQPPSVIASLEMPIFPGQGASLESPEQGRPDVDPYGFSGLDLRKTQPTVGCCRLDVEEAAGCSLELRKSDEETVSTTAMDSVPVVHKTPGVFGTTPSPDKDLVLLGVKSTDLRENVIETPEPKAIARGGQAESCFVSPASNKRKHRSTAARVVLKTYETRSKRRTEIPIETLPASAKKTNRMTAIEPQTGRASTTGVGKPGREAVKTGDGPMRAVGGAQSETSRLGVRSSAAESRNAVSDENTKGRSFRMTTRSHKAVEGHSRPTSREPTPAKRSKRIAAKAAAEDKRSVKKVVRKSRK